MFHIFHLYFIAELYQALTAASGSLGVSSLVVSSEGFTSADS